MKTAIRSLWLTSLLTLAATTEDGIAQTDTNTVATGALRSTTAGLGRMADGLRPEEYGAVGNGIADDTAAVQRVIDLASVFSNAPVLLTRTYRITRPLLVTNYCTILGTRQSYQPAHLDGAGLTGTNAVLQLQGDFDGFCMRNVTISGPGRTVAGSAALRILGSRAADMGHIEISTCTFANAYYGFYASAIAGASFNDCLAYNTHAGGVVTNAVGNGIVFKNWNCKGLPDTGLELRGASAVVIIGMEANATNACLAAYWSRVTIIGANLEHFVGTDLTQAAIFGDAAAISASAIYTRQAGHSVVLKDGATLTYENCIWGTTGRPKLVALGEGGHARFVDLSARSGDTSGFDIYWLTNSTQSVTGTVYCATQPYGVAPGSGVTVTTNDFGRLFTVSATNSAGIVVAGANTTVVADGSTYAVNIGSQVDVVTNLTTTNFFSPATWWSFDEGTSPWADAVNGNSLRLQGAAKVIANASGKMLRCLTNGGGTAVSHLYAADSEDVSYTGAFTVLAWVCQSTGGAGAYSWLWKTNEWGLRCSGDAARRLEFLVGRDFVRATNAAVLGGSWAFVAAWYDGLDASIQVNNGAVHTRAISAPSDTTSGLGVLIPHTDGGGAAIDETAIFKRVLTADERAYFYNFGSGQMLQQATVQSTSGHALLSGAFVLPQLGAIPTNAIPASSPSATNWVQCNIGGLVRTVATNHGAAGSFLKLVGETVSAWP